MPIKSSFRFGRYDLFVHSNLVKKKNNYGFEIVLVAFPIRIEFVIFIIAYINQVPAFLSTINVHYRFCYLITTCRHISMYFQTLISIAVCV